MKKIREKLITRTIKAVSISTQVYSIAEGKVLNKSGIMPFIFNKLESNDQLAFCREIMETETEKVLTVSITGIIAEKYAMTESDFIKHGHKMTKEEEEENAEDTEEEEG